MNQTEDTPITIAIDLFQTRLKEKILSTGQITTEILEEVEAITALLEKKHIDINFLEIAKQDPELNQYLVSPKKSTSTIKV